MILVFKTTVDTNGKARKLRPYLNELPAVKWNFDLMDCDRILRVETPENIANTIIHTLNKQGFDCVELD
jgi:hypothetical protein